MPVARYRAEADEMDYTPGVSVAAGTVISLNGQTMGLSNTDIAANQKSSLRIAGMIEVDCDAGIAAVAGQELGLNTTTQKAVTSGGTGSLKCYAMETPTASATRIRVRMNSNG